jgi:hypothetical protein
MDTIETVIEKFPFEKVHQYMVATDWKWLIPTRLTMGVPTIEELKDTARELLQEAQNSKRPYSSCSTGGLVADKFTWDGIIELRLSFVPWSSRAHIKEGKV